MTSRRSFLSLAAASAGAGFFPDLIREALAVPAHSATGSLADVGHVVIFMQENRSFDHYFGTLSGVRGFGDPRAITLPDGNPVWYQPDGAGKHVLPFHFDVRNTSALSVGTDHSWKGSQQDWQGWDAWVRRKGALTMGHFDRADLPFYYALADAFTICDAYHCAIFGATDPNRMVSLTGTTQGWLGDMGNLYNINAAGYYNNDPASDDLSAAVTAGAPAWLTYAEVLEANQVSWKVYQEWDNYGDNYLAYFRQFRVNADGTPLSPASPLYQKGRTLARGSTAANAPGTKGDWLVAQFADDVRANRLPQVSWICAPNDYTEHAPNSPNAGENLAARLLAALVANPQVWSRTVFLLMYDENDGFFDHVPAPIPPGPGMGRTTLADVGQYETYQGVPVGLGPRVPMLVISPWSKGGRVCSQLLDHTSKLRFLEQWLVQGLGKDPAEVRCDQISPWRRAVCGDLTSAFDFGAPNAGWPASVPATAAYERVTGKPEPSPPAVQTLPRQEPGTRPACALPYALAVDGRVNATHQFTLDFYNTGRAGACFIVHSCERNDGPWFYTVEAGKSVTTETWNWSGAGYDLRVQGPNGFLRHFRGSTAHAMGPEVFARERAGACTVVLTLTNPGGQACTLTITDLGYGAGVQTRTIAPGQTQSLELALGANQGWYDLVLSTDTDAAWMRHLAGHVETGQASVTDPQIGRTRTAPALTADTPVVKRGEPARISYAIPDGKWDPKNWVGLYRQGVAPGQGAGSLQWSYAPAASGTVTFTSAALSPGGYAAWLLFQDGYAVLGGPCPFTVA